MSDIKLGTVLRAKKNYVDITKGDYYKVIRVHFESNKKIPTLYEVVDDALNDFGMTKEDLLDIFLVEDTDESIFRVNAQTIIRDFKEFEDSYKMITRFGLPTRYNRFTGVLSGVKIFGWKSLQLPGRMSSKNAYQA